MLEQDHQRKMKAKLRNKSYKPWKNDNVTAKDTPFGNFGPRTSKEDFDFSGKKSSYEGGMASINVCRKRV